MRHGTTPTLMMYNACGSSTRQLLQLLLFLFRDLLNVQRVQFRSEGIVQSSGARSMRIIQQLDTVVLLLRWWRWLHQQARRSWRPRDDRSMRGGGSCRPLCLPITISMMVVVVVIQYEILRKQVKPSIG